MKCTNCGANLRDDASYCIRCGSKINNDGISINNNTNINKRSLNNYDLDNLVKAYVGDNYDKFIYSGFSLLYFIFGPIYGFIRRMYSFSIIHLIIILGITYIGREINQMLLCLLLFISVIIFSFDFKKRYINTVKTRVNMIIDNNQNLDIIMLQDKCRKKGGINTFVVILYFIIIISSIVLYFIMLKK